MGEKPDPAQGPREPGTISAGGTSAAPREILGASHSVSVPREAEGSWVQGWRRLVMNALRVLPTCALNRRAVLPGVCHGEDRDVLIGASSPPLEMLTDGLC